MRSNSEVTANVYFGLDPSFYNEKIGKNMD
jgi:hypothetical protein